MKIFGYVVILCNTFEPKCHHFWKINIKKPTEISDYHHLICMMLKSKYERMTPKLVIDLINTLRKNSLKKLLDLILLILGVEI